jgi:hypothetical protein
MSSDDFMVPIEIRVSRPTRHYLPPTVASFAQRTAAEILCGCRGRKWTRDQEEVTCRKCRKLLREATTCAP